MIDRYLEKMNSVMTIQEKCYVYIQLNQHFHRSINAKIMINMLEETETITYDEFMAISSLVEQLPKSEHHLIKTILEKVK